MSLNYQEPIRFQEQNLALDNFSDIAMRTKVMEKGLFSTTLPYPVAVSMSIGCMDDLVQVIEQDYYLNKMIYKKLGYISQEKDIFDATCRLVEVYLSVNHVESTQASQVKTFVLSNLNLI